MLLTRNAFNRVGEVIALGDVHTKEPHTCESLGFRVHEQESSNENPIARL